MDIFYALISEAPALSVFGPYVGNIVSTNSYVNTVLVWLNKSIKEEGEPPLFYHNRSCQFLYIGL